MNTMPQQTKKTMKIEIDKTNYDGNVIKENMMKLKISKSGSTILTKYDNHTIYQASCSEKYHVFDFGDFVNDKLSQIESVFEPASFSLKINRGIQQLMFYKDPISIHGENYSPVMLLFSSSNGYHPLILDIGLFRFACSNGLMIPATINEFKIKSRHFHLTLNKKMDQFEKRLPFYPEVIETQTEFINSLQNNSMSYKQFLKQLILKTISEERKTMLKVADQLAKKLIKSESDQVDTTLLNEKEMQGIANPVQLLRGDDNCKDVEIPMFKLYNCYTEIFRFRHGAVLENENKRVTNILLNEMGLMKRTQFE